MKKLLKNLEELEGRTIESVEIETGYSAKVIIRTNDDCILILTTYGDYEDHDNTNIYVEDTFSYYDKLSFDLLTEDDIEKHKIEEEKKKQEKIKKEEEEKKKAKEEDKMRKSELELLAKLKNKYEK